MDSVHNYTSKIKLCWSCLENIRELPLILKTCKRERVKHLSCLSYMIGASEGEISL